MRLRYAVYAVGLAGAWVMLWDQLSLANLVGGLVVASVLLAAFPLRTEPVEERRRVRPVALARLVLTVLRDVLVSNVHVSRTTVSRNQRLRTGVIACRMRTSSPKVLSTVANIIALSPGMMAVDATRDPATLYVHVLMVDSVVGIRRRVAQLERLVIEAVGSLGDRELLAVDLARRAGPLTTAETR